MKDIFNDEYYLLWRLLSQTRNALVKAKRRELAPHKLLPRQGSILLIVGATGGMVTAYQIARWSILEPHAISALLKRMERDGLINKIETNNIKKSYKIILTEKGRRAYNIAAKYESNRECMAILSKEERKRLRAILYKLRGEAFKKIGITAKLPFPPF